MLKVKFWRIGTVVVAKILEQDESLRSSFGDEKKIGSRTYNGERYIVKSINVPQIEPHTLYIRGNKREGDNRYRSYNFVTEEKAKDYIIAMNKIIHDINIESFLKKDFHVPDEEVEVTITE